MSAAYWEESVKDALCEAGIEATPDQIADVVQSIVISAENEGMATGRDAIQNPMLAEVDRVRRAGEERVSHAETSAAKEIAELNGTIQRLRYRINELETEARR